MAEKSSWVTISCAHVPCFVSRLEAGKARVPQKRRWRLFTVGITTVAVCRGIHPSTHPSARLEKLTLQASCHCWKARCGKVADAHLFPPWVTRLMASHQSIKTNREQTGCCGNTRVLAYDSKSSMGGCAGMWEYSGGTTSYNVILSK